MSKSALFVCLGNICRSPIAEAVFKQLVADRGQAGDWIIDSAATSTYEIGSSPDHRGQALMRKKDIYKNVEKHRARQITKADYENFQFIFGMDDSNMSNLKRMAPKNYSAKLLKLGDFDTDKSFQGIIEDPYYAHDDAEFERVYQQCLRSCTAFLDSL